MTTLQQLTKVVPSGSYHICTPKVTDTDIDFFCLHSREVVSLLLSKGYTYGEDRDFDDEYTRGFMSLRKKNINIILVDTQEDLDKIELATKLCKLLNLKKKEHRLAVFNAIRYGVVSTKRSVEL